MAGPVSQNSGPIRGPTLLKRSGDSGPTQPPPFTGGGIVEQFGKKQHGFMELTTAGILLLSALALTVPEFGTNQPQAKKTQDVDVVVNRALQQLNPPQAALTRAPLITHRDVKKYQDADFFRNFVLLQPVAAATPPFSQTQWEQQIRKSYQEVDSRLNTNFLSSVIAATAPFVQTQWEYQPRKSYQDVDFFRNNPLLSAIVAAIAPFNQTQWDAYSRKLYQQPDAQPVNALLLSGRIPAQQRADDPARKSYQSVDASPVNALLLSGRTPSAYTFTDNFRKSSQESDFARNTLILTPVAAPQPPFIAQAMPEQQRASKYQPTTPDFRNLLFVLPPLVTSPFSQFQWEANPGKSRWQDTGNMQVSLLITLPPVVTSGPQDFHRKYRRISYR